MLPYTINGCFGMVLLNIYKLLPSLKTENMTDTIYKYVDFNGLECILKNRTLRFKHPQDFNDPFEFHDCLVDRRLSISHLKEIHKKLDKNLTKKRLNLHIKIFKSENRDFQEIQYKLFETRKATTRVCCFSEINDNLLMWAHYADEHKGACIEFSAESLKSNYRKDSMLCKVNYSTRICSKNISKYREKAILHWISTKGRAWNYEREIRIILGSDPVEFQEFDFHAIKQIIFGCRVSEDEKNKIENLILEKNKCPWIKTSEMNISKDKFKLENSIRH